MRVFEAKERAQRYFVMYLVVGLGFQIHSPQQVSEARVVAEGELQKVV